MSFSKETISPGDGKTFPKPGDEVTMEYTGELDNRDSELWLILPPGWLADPSKPDGRGKQFDTSVGKGSGDFVTKIGVGRVIQGWDQGVPQMSLGERAVLTIPGNMAYGERGFPGFIPPKCNADLVSFCPGYDFVNPQPGFSNFRPSEVQLKKIK